MKIIVMIMFNMLQQCLSLKPIYSVTALILKPSLIGGLDRGGLGVEEILRTELEGDYIHRSNSIGSSQDEASECRVQETRNKV